MRCLPAAKSVCACAAPRNVAADAEGLDAMRAGILARVAEYVDAGVSKFILRPLGGDDDTILTQTRLLIEQVLPLAETRWPKRAKVITVDQ